MAEIHTDKPFVETDVTLLKLYKEAGKKVLNEHDVSNFWIVFASVFHENQKVTNCFLLRLFNVLMCYQVWLLSALDAVKVSPLIDKVGDHKDFKKLLRTRTNVLVLYTKTGTAGT